MRPATSASNRLTWRRRARGAFAAVAALALGPAPIRAQSIRAQSIRAQPSQAQSSQAQPNAGGGATPWSPPAPTPWGDSVTPAGAGDTVGEITVTKLLPGPALWKITRDGAQVFVLGGLTPLPHMLAWDTARLEHALEGADALYLQPRTQLGAFGALGLMLNKGALQLPRGQTLETALPPRERTRFLQMMTTIHGKASTYDRWKPAVAGVLLIADYRKAAGLSDAKPGSTVMHLAEGYHVPVRYVGAVDLGAFVKAAATLSPAENLGCFDAAMDDIDQESAHAPAAAAAWASANLRAVGQTYRVSLLDRCLLRIPSGRSVMAKGVDEGVRTIETALVQGRKSVAVIDLNFLMQPNGVLDQVRAWGATITTPTDL